MARALLGVVRSPVLSSIGYPARARPATAIATPAWVRVGLAATHGGSSGRASRRTDAARATFSVKASDEIANTAFKANTTLMMPPGTFDGKVAFITGGGTGLGLGMATALSQLGCTVCLSSRRTAVIESAASNITRLTGNKVHAIACDVRDPEAVAGAIDELEAKAGVPDIVINNAAGNFVSPTERLSANGWRTIVDIVLNGTAYVTLEVGRRVVASKELQKRGTVFLCVTTTYTRTGSAFVVPSASAKAGVDVLIKSLASEWGRYGMRFVGIAPGPIETKGAFGRLDPTGTFKDEMLNRIPAGRMGTIEEMANMATFLTSPYASWVNGDTVTLDGGELAGMTGAFNSMSALGPEDWDDMARVIRGIRKK